MKKIVGILAVVLLFSCSSDDTTSPQTTQLEKDIKDCVQIELDNQNNKNIPPPGLTPLCECIEIALAKHNQNK